MLCAESVNKEKKEMGKKERRKMNEWTKERRKERKKENEWMKERMKEWKFLLN